MKETQITMLPEGVFGTIPNLLSSIGTNWTFRTPSAKLKTAETLIKSAFPEQKP